MFFVFFSSFFYTVHTMFHVYVCDISYMLYDSKARPLRKSNLKPTRPTQAAAMCCNHKCGMLSPGHPHMEDFFSLSVSRSLPRKIHIIVIFCTLRLDLHRQRHPELHMTHDRRRRRRRRRGRRGKRPLRLMWYETFVFSRRPLLR